MSVELNGQINSFLKHVFKCGFCSKLYTVEAIADDADIDLFRIMANPCHCIHSLVPPVKSCNHYLRPKGHIHCVQKKHLLVFSFITSSQVNQFAQKFQHL